MKENTIRKSFCVLFFIELFSYSITFGNASVRTIKVDNYLNRGSDTKAMYSAFKDALDTKGAVVLNFGNRIYNIEPDEIISNLIQNNKVILFNVKSDMTISGGDNTQLILKKGWIKGLNRKLLNFIFIGSRNYISNFSVNDISIDFNGADNNLITKFTLNNSFLFIPQGRNITISNVKVLNNPGEQSIAIGSADKKGGYLTRNVNINHCQFLNNTDAFSNNKQSDHSSIYVAADSADISNNLLSSGSKLSNVATAIEAHTVNSIIQYNKILNYSTGINIVATDGDQINTIYSNNIMRNVSQSFVFWGDVGRLIANITISDNKIYQAPVNVSIIGMANTLKGYISNLNIINNYFSSRKTKTIEANNKMVGNCIEIGFVKSINIQGNTFENINGRAITLVNSDFSIDQINISNNDFRDINISGNPSYKEVIGFKAIGKIGQIKISGNKLNGRNSFYTLGSQVQIRRKLITNNN